MPKPILQSLILADHVYEDKLTGKRIIAGIFNRIIRGVRVIREVPAPAPPTPPPPAPTSPVQPSQPIQVQPPQPVQPVEPIQVHHGQSVAPPPSSPTAPSQPTAAAESHPPAAPHVAPPPAAPPPAPAPTSNPASPPAHAPAFAQQPSAPPPQSAPPSPPAPVPAPHAPPSQPLQPGQRVLEIPPTGLQSGSPFAYLSLTEVRGRTPLMLQLVNLQDDTQLFRSDLMVECHNPLYTIEMTVPLPPIAPPQAGIYALELLYNNELLGSLRIVVEDAAQ
jgi:hypothetical protein